MKNLKNDIADLKSVANQLLLQTTMNTVKINVLKSMVLGVYAETLDETSWKNIHRNYYNTLGDEMKEVFNSINEITFESINMVKHSLDFQIMVANALKNLDD